MQTEKSVYKEIEDLLEGVELPRMALVEQRIGTPATLPDIGEAVRDALRQVGLPSGSAPSLCKPQSPWTSSARKPL